MKLVRLDVQRFQCIEQATVEFGPHLNVLYGPNDLGKSSLAWAIRAVLLLQHGSSHAERFSSWYGQGDPRVALTLQHDDARYWRVTKQFGGSSGRSTLESSKDGRTFTSEASARDVDRRVRELLRWGLAEPGGKGRTVFPETFLTQVLLADQSQDSVRKILFEPQLDKDADESGRARLVEALGALAQDPLFKQVIDRASERVDEAFTPKGMRRRAAGSPWAEIAERITRLRVEQEQCEQAVKDSEGVEANIKALQGRRDVVQARLTDAEDELAAARRRLAVRQERDRLDGEIAKREGKLREVEALAAGVVAAQERVDELERQVATAAGDEANAVTKASEHEARRDELRGRLDAAHGDAEAARRLEALHEAEKAAEAVVREGQAALEKAEAALLAASGAVRRLGTVAGEAEAAVRAAGAAQEAVTGAAAAVEAAQRAVEDAREQQRVARSGEQAQARALRRQELENRRLTLTARRDQLAAAVERARKAGERAATLDVARKELQRAEAAAGKARTAVESGERKTLELDGRRRALAQLERYGRHRALRRQLDEARRASEDVERERRRAAELREEAERLRERVRPELPAAERLAALRVVRDELRLAEASLGGGLSVVVRPRRPLTVRATRDGEAAASITGSEPVVLEARRVLGLQLDELVDIEIAAGEESARSKATALRHQWLREGEPLLIEHHVSTLDELEAARASSDEAARAVEQATREAAVAEERAGATVAHDLDGLQQQLAEAEAELAGADREDLADRLARLGEPWQNGLRRQQAALDGETEAHQQRLAGEREALAGLVAKAAAQGDVVRGLTEEVQRAEQDLGGAWAAAVASGNADLAAIAGELAEVDAQLQRASDSDTSDTAAADAAVARAASALEAARAAHAAAQARLDAARADEVRTRTVLDATVAEARQLDLDGAWSAALDAGRTDLPTTAWTTGKAQAAQRLQTARTAHVAAQRAVTDEQEARTRAVQQLRTECERADTAAKDARAAAARSAATRERIVASHHEAVVALGEQKLAIARVNVAETRREMAELRERRDAVGPDPGAIDEEAVLALQGRVERCQDELRELDEALAGARGQLALVGGAIARERLAEVTAALDRARERERELEVEYEAWKLLKQTLLAAESGESAHLGRALAQPVAERFHRLTGGRYGAVELDAQLEPGGILVEGELRDLDALSAGTQDQLATLLRVCIAEQLRTTIVLDDHLSQSDTGRLAWFNAMLRDAAQHVQIVLITCRPQELLADDERPAPGDATRDAGRVRAIDLSRIIQRYGPPTPPPRPAR